MAIPHPELGGVLAMTEAGNRCGVPLCAPHAVHLKVFLVMLLVD